MEKPKIFKSENGNWITRWIEPVLTFARDEPLLITCRHEQHPTWRQALQHANNIAKEMRTP